MFENGYRSLCVQYTRSYRHTCHDGVSIVLLIHPGSKGANVNENVFDWASSRLGAV